MSEEFPKILKFRLCSSPVSLVCWPAKQNSIIWECSPWIISTWALISLAVTYKHDCTGLHLHCIQNATSTNLNAKSDSKIKEQESCELRRSWAYIEGTIINRWMYLSERSNQRRSLVMLLYCCSFSSTITDYISKCSYFFLLLTVQTGHLDRFLDWHWSNGKLYSLKGWIDYRTVGLRCYHLSKTIVMYLCYFQYEC